MPLYEYPDTTLPIDGGDRSAQSHLDWLKSAARAIDLGWWLQNRVWAETTTGALSYGPQNDDSLAVVETTVPSMKVKVLIGAGFLLGVPFRKTSDTTLTDNLVAPISLPRIDTIGIDPTDGSVIVYEGTPHASPTAPYVGTGIFKAGEIYCRVGMTEIHTTEQSTGGYVQNRSTLFYLPGDAPHTSGLTVSGGAFIHDGTSGDITLPADGLSIQTDYAGKFNMDATNAAGYLNFRTGGTTDRLTLGIPAQPITLHGSSHDLILSANGETLQSSGANAFIIEQAGGTGINLKTDSTLRYTLDADGDHHFIGSLGEVQVKASGNLINMTRAGANEIKATDAAGTLALHAMNDSTAHILLAGAINLLGTGALYEFLRTEPTLNVTGTGDFTIDREGGVSGITLQTDSADRYQISAAGQHDIWGDAYFHNDVYILGILYIDGVPVTGDDLGGSSGYATITLPGTVFEPAASGGSGGADSAEFGSNVLLFQSFLNAADGYCMAPNLLMPLNYNDAAAVHVRVRWSANSTSANQVRFLAYTAPQGEGDAANQTLNTAATILDSNGTTANIIHVSDWTALPVTGIVAGDAMALRLDRTPTHADDTLAVDIRVHSVDIRYTRGATA